MLFNHLYIYTDWYSSTKPTNYKLDEFEFEFREYSGSFRPDKTGSSVKLPPLNTRGISVAKKRRRKNALKYTN